MAQGNWLGPGRRWPLCAQSCFPKENPWGVGFSRQRPRAKQQGPGSQGQPNPALRYGERGAGDENGLRCFPQPRCFGADVCCQTRVSLCRMPLPEARLGPSVRRGLGAERLSCLGGMAGAWAQKAFPFPILLPHEGEPVGSGFRLPETPRKAAGPREPGEALPSCALWSVGAWGGKRLALLS